MSFDVRSFKERHLIVAGEIGVDEYLFGGATRISPEAPVPVVEVESQAVKLGLAANVAQNVCSLGAKTTLLSVRGQDAAGEEISRLIREAGIDQSVLIEDPSRPTMRKVRVLAGKQHVVRVDYEKTHSLDVGVAKKFRETLCDLLPSSDGVILQDYGKGLWTTDVVSFIQHARSHKKPVFVDPSRLSAASLYHGCTLLSPNAQEAAYLAGNSLHAPSVRGNEDSVLEGFGRSILRDTDAEHVIITCGAWGMVSLSKEDPTLKRIPTFAKEVFDVTGAGDTVIAVLALAQVSGRTLVESMHLANAAAGIVVGRIGTSFVTPEELQHAPREVLL